MYRNEKWVGYVQSISAVLYIHKLWIYLLILGSKMSRYSQIFWSHRVTHIGHFLLHHVECHQVSESVIFKRERALGVVSLLKNVLHLQ
jgi:hypothetical protein